MPFSGIIKAYEINWTNNACTDFAFVVKIGFSSAIAYNFYIEQVRGRHQKSALKKGHF